MRDLVCELRQKLGNSTLLFPWSRRTIDGTAPRRCRHRAKQNMQTFKGSDVCCGWLHQPKICFVQQSYATSTSEWPRNSDQFVASGSEITLHLVTPPGFDSHISVTATISRSCSNPWSPTRLVTLFTDLALMRPQVRPRCDFTAFL